MAGPTHRRPAPPPAASCPPGLTARYRLALGPFSWEFRGETELGPWLARFARILELEAIPAASPPGPGTRLVTFIAAGTEEPGRPLRRFLESPPGWRLPRTGWQLRYFFPLLLWSHPASRDIIGEVVSGENDDLAVDSMVRACYPVFESAIEAGGFPLHTALVARDGFGVALAASGGTGKSTCARRIPSPWRALCDDAAVIVPSGEVGFQAHPFATWSDYLWKRSEGTWNVAAHVPLRALFFLKQAEADKASAIGQGEAAIYVSRSASEILMPFIRRMGSEASRALQSRAFDNACRLAKAVPAFILEVSLEGRFWTEMDRVLG
jgi:SynChlorMet cassette protein ScmC